MAEHDEHPASVSPSTLEPGPSTEGEEARGATAEAAEPGEPADESSPDLEDRVLCSDGTCVGVVGPDGRCKVCGASGELPETVRRPVSAADLRPAPRAEARSSDGASDTVALEDRILCSDGTCIGVVGADGRCRECGKPYTGDPDD